MLLAVIMVLSVFSVAVIPAGAASVESFFSVSETDFVNDEITYTFFRCYYDRKNRKHQYFYFV